MVTTAIPPSDSAQLLFLSRVQRLLESGRFTATYKFALFLALAELAVEMGDESGAELHVPLDALAERFLTLYWRQASPYPANGAATVLRQNTGQQAAIITRIGEAHQRLDVSLGAAKEHPQWHTLVTAARQIIVRMPLLRLQTLGNDETTTREDCFLYANVVPDHQVTLFPGVAFCLRRFFPLLQGMVRAKWLTWVQAHNSDVLGTVQDLESFMFGTKRGDIRRLVGVLLELQSGRCFYQPRTQLDVKTAQIDHFIPWAKYPCDAVPNFVLASPAANAKKKDHLAATEYLERWCSRNDKHHDRLGVAAKAAGMDRGDGAILKVAAWAYGNHDAIGGLVWHACDGLIRLDPKWRQVLHV